MTDIEIARSVTLQPIEDVATSIGLRKNDLLLYGPYKAKVTIDVLNRLLEQNHQRGKLILVSAMTPTPAGEGKTTVSIGLSQALNLIGKKAVVTLREPSLGPVMGRKGGATGGGYAQVLPMEDINLHFTGDFHAITAAHNLLAAAIDNHLHFDNSLRLSPMEIMWRRVVDLNDRALRHIVTGLGGKKNGPTRESGYDITAASEIMAILCLSLSYTELRERIEQILVGFTYDGEPVLARDLNVAGAMTALLKDAFLPNLVQTIEHTPAFIHGGPFANIAQGTNSIVATKLALQLADYVVTEAGFGFDLGAEKFFDIVCRVGGFVPSVVVLVATVRALKMHGGVKLAEVQKPNVEAVFAGRENLEKHIENIRKFGVTPIVAINRFTTDSPEELEAVKQICADQGCEAFVVDFWAQGGKGGTELAARVAEVVDSVTPKYRPLYSLEQPVEEKILTVAREMYGAAAVDYRPEAKRALRRIYALGYDKLPVCIAKTQQSLSDNPKLLGRPKDFLVTVRDIVISAGAGFLVPLTGDILRMPGLPRTPAAERITIDDQGNITGLF